MRQRMINSISAGEFCTYLSMALVPIEIHSVLFDPDLSRLPDLGEDTPIIKSLVTAAKKYFNNIFLDKSFGNFQMALLSSILSLDLSPIISGQ